MCGYFHSAFRVVGNENATFGHVEKLSFSFFSNYKLRASGVEIIMIVWLLTRRVLCCRYHKVITPMGQFASVRDGLQEAGIEFDADISGLELIPVSEIEVSSCP